MKQAFTVVFVLLTIIGNAQDLDEIPMRPAENYLLKMDLEFKKKPPLSSREINYMDQTLQNKTKLLPFMSMSLEILNQNPEEYRVKIYRIPEKTSQNYKLKGEPINFDVGYTDDVKDRLKSYKIHLIVSDKKRNPIDQIILIFDAEGNLFVNQQPFGKI